MIVKVSMYIGKTVEDEKTHFLSQIYYCQDVCPEGRRHHLQDDGGVLKARGGDQEGWLQQEEHDGKGCHALQLQGGGGGPKE